MTKIEFNSRRLNSENFPNFYSTLILSSKTTIYRSNDENHSQVEIREISQDLNFFAIFGLKWLFLLENVKFEALGIQPRYKMAEFSRFMIVLG